MKKLDMEVVVTKKSKSKQKNVKKNK